MFTDLSKFDWVLKDNPVIVPSKSKGTTEVNFISQEHKNRIMSKINLKNRY